MREVGEVRKRLTGDSASAYIPIARKALGQLKNLISFQGLKQLVWTWRLADGTVIRVGSIHGQDFVDIVLVKAAQSASLLSGFICLPVSDAVSRESTLLRYTPSGWKAKSLKNANYGNVDWRGPRGLTLSWIGPWGRYGPTYDAGSHPDIYYQGKVLASLPPYAYTTSTDLRVAGAAVTTVDKTRYLLCIVTNSSPGEVYVFRRLFRERYVDNDLYNQTTNPSGWQLLGTRSASQDTLGQEFWYFNESGTEALSAGYKIVQDRDKQVKSSLLTVLDIGEETVSFTTTDYGYIKRVVEVQKTPDSGEDFELLGYVYSVEVIKGNTLSMRLGPEFNTLAEAQGAADAEIEAYKAQINWGERIGEYYVVLYQTVPPYHPAPGPPENAQWGMTTLLSYAYSETQNEVEDSTFPTSGFIRQDSHPYKNYIYKKTVTLTEGYASELWNQDGEQVLDDTSSPIPGPGFPYERVFASSTIPGYALVRRTTYSLDHQEYQATFTGKYLAAADYNGDTQVLGLLEPTGAQSFIYDSQSMATYTNAPPVHHPRVGFNSEYWTFYFTSEESQDDLTKEGSSTLAIKCGDIFFHQAPAANDSGVITTNKPLFWDLRSGAYVLDKGVDSSAGNTTHRLVVKDSQEVELASLETVYTWQDTDYGRFDLEPDTYFYYDTPSWFIPTLGNGISNGSQVFCSYQIEETFGKGIHYYNYLTGGDPVLLTDITAGTPRFYPLGYI